MSLTGSLFQGSPTPSPPLERHDADRLQEGDKLEHGQLEGLEHAAGVRDEGVLALAEQLGHEVNYALFVIPKH